MRKDVAPEIQSRPEGQTALVMIALTPSEMAGIENCAAAAGLDKFAWMRAKLIEAIRAPLPQTVRPHHWRKEP